MGLPAPEPLGKGGPDLQYLLSDDTFALILAAVAVEISVAQMLKVHLSFVKVSVAVAVGADNHVLLPCFECC